MIIDTLSTICCCYNYKYDLDLTMDCINFNNVNRNVCFGKFVEVLDAKRIIYNIVVSLEQYQLKGAFLDKVVPSFRLLINSYYNVFKNVVVLFLYVE